jgi:hypothetical protein
MLERFVAYAETNRLPSPSAWVRAMIWSSDRGLPAAAGEQQLALPTPVGETDRRRVCGQGEQGRGPGLGRTAAR